MPTNNLLLDSFVDATSGSSISIAAPSGGLPVGGTFRVNLVQDQNDLNTIYAQSDEFTISAGAASSGSTTVTSGTGSTGTPSGTTASLSNTVTGGGASYVSFLILSLFLF